MQFKRAAGSARVPVLRLNGNGEFLLSTNQPGLAWCLNGSEAVQ